MRIAQVLSPTATAFEHKSQAVDFDALRAEHDVTVVRSGKEAAADVVHFYDRRPRVERPRGSWIARRQSVRIAPLQAPGVVLVPEAVDDRWFRLPVARDRGSTTIGTFRRPALGSVIGQTLARIHRTREDVEWVVFDGPPVPEQIEGIDVWVDPAVDEHDFDGFVAEALAAGLPVVASRTAINVQRLEKGRTGFLTPVNDANELTHAILSALFKPEVAQQKIDAARQTSASSVRATGCAP